MQTRNFTKLASYAMIISFVIYGGCSSSDEPKPVDCATSDLAITLGTKTDPAGCGTNNGSISVTASGGDTPYQFKLNSGALGSASTFTDLNAGAFTVTVKDKNGCEKELLGVTLNAPAAPVAGTPTLVSQTDCATPNGSIAVSATGGAAPYEYKLGSGSFGSTAIFSNLKAGNYTVTIKDAASCTITVNGTIASATGVSYANDIAPILEANCNKSGCHNGDNGADRNWSVFANVQSHAQGIKTRTGNKSMPKDIAPAGLPQEQIDLIACWVDGGALNN